MARRTASSEELTALARQAVEQVEASEDPAAEAARVLREAEGLRLRQTIVEMCAVAPERAAAGLVAAALESGEPALARTAADALVTVADSQSGLDLLRLCLSVADPTVRARGLEALEAFSDASVLDLMPDALADESASVRRAAVGAIGLIVGIAHHPLRGRVLEALADREHPLTRAITGSDDEQIRRQMAQSLAFVGSDAALPTLELLCKDEDAEVRQEAVVCLSAVRTDQATDLMARMLSDPSPTVASSVLDTLAARLGATTAGFLQYLRRALEHPAAQVRRHAVLMLTGFRGEEVVPVLEKATADADFEVARSAGEMLRRIRPEADLGWLSDEMARQGAGERVLPMWEAGNIGLEGSGDALRRMLESALRSGSASDRVHAVNELASVVDIADSPALRGALDDSDGSVRTRAADALQYTRDAGLLAELVREHQDPMLRRLAIEALARNPGGPARPGSARAGPAFSSTRSLGPELFSSFLGALEDPDEGVRQLACAAIRGYARSGGPVPVADAVRGLESLAEDEGLSFLTQDEAAQTADEVRKSGLARPILDGVEQVLAWRGQTAREAQAVRWDAALEGYVLGEGLAEEVPARWADAYRLSEEDASSVAAAIGAKQALDPRVARRVLAGLARDLVTALECVRHASDALRLTGGPDCRDALEGWAAAVRVAPGLDWGPQKAGQALLRRLHRLRLRAWIAARLAAASLDASPSPDFAADALQDPDEWVRLCALTAGLDWATDRQSALGEVASLAGKYAGRRDFRGPVAAAAVALLQAGDGGATALAEAALGEGRVDSRMALVRQLTAAAHDDRAAARIEDHLAGRPVDTLGRLCLALALRGAGRRLDVLEVPPTPQGARWSESVCARLALGAMDNDPEAVSELERMLRSGTTAERCASAYYLTLARVRSALVVLVSAQDQSDAPYLLRGLCAACLVRRGHPAGAPTLAGMFRSAPGRPKAELLMHLCRAVEDAIRLMLQCGDVDAGRFV